VGVEEPEFDSVVSHTFLNVNIRSILVAKPGGRLLPHLVRRSTVPTQWPLPILISDVPSRTVLILFFGGGIGHRMPPACSPIPSRCRQP